MRRGFKSRPWIRNRGETPCHVVAATYPFMPKPNLSLNKLQMGLGVKS